MGFEVPNVCSKRVGVFKVFCCCQSRLSLCVMLPSLLVEAKLLYLLKCSVPQSSSQQTSEDSVHSQGNWCCFEPTYKDLLGQKLRASLCEG